MVSITEVAKLAGFSHATVSRVLNKRAGVSGEAEAAVLKAMEELGYSPADRRRGRKPKDRAGLKHGTIALLMMRTEAMLVKAPVTAAVLHGAEKALSDAGLNLMVSQVLDDGRLPPTVADGKVDGLLLHGFLPPRSLVERLSTVPSVWLLSPRDDIGYFGNRVSPDNEAIGRIAAEHLVRQGHTRLVYLFYNPSHGGFELRRRAFVHTAGMYGAACDVIDIRHDGPTAEICDRAVDALLASSPRPTGVFVPSDRAMVEIHRRLQQRGVDIASSFDLVSCDNDPVLQGLNPRPATIDLNCERIGREAVTLLLNSINAGGSSLRHQMLVSPELVESEDRSAFEEA